MKQKLFTSVAMAVILAFAISCSEDNAQDRDNSGDPEITAARSYFDAHVKNVQILNSGNALTRSEMRYDPQAIPEWEKARVCDIGGTRVVEVPLKTGNIYAMQNRVVDGVLNQQKAPIYSVLALAKGPDGTYNAHVATLIGDKGYRKDKSNDVKMVGYEVLGSNFSGIFILSSTEGELLRGYVMQEGRRVQDIRKREAATRTEQATCGHDHEGECSGGHHSHDHDATQLDIWFVDRNMVSVSYWNDWEVYCKICYDETDIYGDLCSYCETYFCPTCWNLFQFCKCWGFHYCIKCLADLPWGQNICDECDRCQDCRRETSQCICVTCAFCGSKTCNGICQRYVCPACGGNISHPLCPEVYCLKCAAPRHEGACICLTCKGPFHYGTQCPKK